MLKMLDLFSGIGGFSLAASWTGEIETVAFCEIEPYPQKVLQKNFPGVPIYDDVRELTAERLRADGIDRVDIITGGFPCQDVSTNGHKVGFEGQRTSLFSEILRLLVSLRPKYAVMENVSGLLSGGGGCGLEAFSLDWPRSGMMQNGTVYRLHNLGRPITEIGSGLWPTPQASDGRRLQFNLNMQRKLIRKGNFVGNIVVQFIKEKDQFPTPSFVEWMMGYGQNWTLVD